LGKAILKRSRFRKLGERFLKVEVEYAEPNSSGDKSDHGAVNIAKNGAGKPAVDFLSNQRSDARSDNHGRCY